MNPSEFELFQRSRNGDPEAFRRIVERHQPFAYAVAYRFLGNPADAEDVVQESFISVWKHLSDFDPKKKFTTWLYRIVANRCLDQIKSRKHGGNPESRVRDPEDGGIVLPSSDPHEKLDEQERIRMIEALVRELPEKQRMVFILRDLQDLSIGETSQILKISGASVKSNLFHARKFLREKIEELERAGL